MKNRKFIGPAFYGIDELKFKKWLIYSSENNVLNKNEYGINYHQEKFGKVLKQSEIEQIIEFSKKNKYCCQHRIKFIASSSLLTKVLADFLG